MEVGRLPDLNQLGAFRLLRWIRQVVGGTGEGDGGL